MKEEVIELLEYVVDRNLIGSFPYAQVSQQTPICEIIPYWEDSGWRSIYLNYYQDMFNEKFLHIPFKEEFLGLDSGNKRLFYQKMEDKIESFSVICKTMINLKDQLRRNLQNIDKTKQFSSKHNLLKDVLKFETFREFEQFLDTYDKY